MLFSLHCNYLLSISFRRIGCIPEGEPWHEREIRRKTEKFTRR